MAKKLTPALAPATQSDCRTDRTHTRGCSLQAARLLPRRIRLRVRALRRPEDSLPAAPHEPSLPDEIPGRRRGECGLTDRRSQTTRHRVSAGLWVSKLREAPGLQQRNGVPILLLRAASPNARDRLLLNATWPHSNSDASYGSKVAPSIGSWTYKRPMHSCGKETTAFD